MEQMNCQTCADLALIKALSKSIPGLAETANAYLLAHLSLAHSMRYADLPVVLLATKVHDHA